MIEKNISNCPICGELDEYGIYYQFKNEEGLRRLFCCKEIGVFFKSSFNDAIDEWNRCVEKFKSNSEDNKFIRDSEGNLRCSKCKILKNQISRKDYIHYNGSGELCE